MQITFCAKPGQAVDPTDLMGGTMHYVSALADYLTTQGLEVVITGNVHPPRTLANGVRYLPLSEDLLHKSDVFISISSIGFLKQVSARLKLILMFDEKPPRSDGVPFRCANELADAVICQSRTNRDSVVRLGVNANRIVVPSLIGGYDPALVPSEHIRSPSLLVYAAATISQKGFDIALDAFPLLKQECPELRLDVYGSAEMWMKDETILRDKADLIGQFPDIRILGRRQLDELYSAFSSAAVLLAPVRYEDAGSLAYVYALACGCPVVGPRHAAIREIVIDGYNGALYLPNTPGELATTVLRLFRDRARLHAMSSNAAEGVKSWTWEAVGAWYLDELRFLLKLKYHKVQPT